MRHRANGISLIDRGWTPSGNNMYDISYYTAS
jgi:hypothetical protein